MTPFSQLSDDQLADQIVTWAGRIAAGEAEQLALIAEFDRREAWGGPGLLSCAHWLSWRTGLSPVAAREKVRVARALAELPLLREAHAAGKVSYSQARAITRVATAVDQDVWIGLARNTTAGQLDRAVRGVRRVQKVQEDEADPEMAAFRMRATKSYDQDGNAVYRIVMPAEDSAVLDAAVDAVRAELDRAKAADASAEAGCPQAAPAEPAPATVAEAFVQMARSTLDRQAEAAPSTARRRRSSLVAQVDPLTGWARLADGELLPRTSLKQVLRSLPGRGDVLRLRPLTDADLRKHDLGRSQRLPSQALRDLVGTLDGERCRFPGCTRHRRLHAHHVTFWSDGGPTDLSNLVLVCSRHHTLIHSQGFLLVLHPDRRLTVSTADGVAVLHHPGLPWRTAAELDPGHRIDADTLPPDSVEARMDLGFVVMVMAQQSA